MVSRKILVLQLRQNCLIRLIHAQSECSSHFYLFQQCYFKTSAIKVVCSQDYNKVSGLRKSNTGSLLREDRVDHNLVQPGLEILQRQRQNIPLQQPVPLPDCPLGEVFSCIQLESLLFRLLSTTSVLQHQEPGSNILITSLLLHIKLLLCFPRCSLLQIEQVLQ